MMDIFLAYGKHQQECEDIIRRIAAGDTNIELDDYFSQNDIEYIENRLRNDYGIYATLTIS
jgi:hypothetical protein